MQQSFKGIRRRHVLQVPLADNEFELIEAAARRWSGKSQYKTATWARDVLLKAARPTVPAAMGGRAAVNSGDNLFARVFRGDFSDFAPESRRVARSEDQNV